MIKFLAGIMFACGCIVVNDVMNFVAARDRQLEEIKEQLKKTDCKKPDSVFIVEDIVVRQRRSCVVV